MTKNKLFLFAAGALTFAALALYGHLPFLLALALWVAFDSALAPRTGRCFANSFGTLNSALIMQQALTLLFTKRPVLKYFSTGLTDEKGVMAKYLQQVIVRTKSVATVQDFIGSTATDVTTVDVAVTLNKWKTVFLTFTPAQYEATARDLIQEQAEPIAIAIGNYIVDACASLMSKVTFPITGAGTPSMNNTVKAASWDYTHLTTVRGQLTSRGVPEAKRFYLASTPVYSSFLNDPMIVAFFNNQQNAEAIRTGLLPEVAGLGISEYPALTTASGDATEVAFAGTPGAIVVASRAPQGPGNFNAPFPGNWGYITDPKSQFTVRVTEWIDPVTFNANVRADWIFGIAAGQLAEGQTITTQ